MDNDVSLSAALRPPRPAPKGLRRLNRVVITVCTIFLIVIFFADPLSRTLSGLLPLGQSAEPTSVAHFSDPVTIEAVPLEVPAPKAITAEVKPEIITPSATMPVLSLPETSPLPVAEADPTAVTKDDFNLSVMELFPVPEIAKDPSRPEVLQMPRNIVPVRRAGMPAQP
ncbi:hypothetical protein [Primorskyibacter sp. S87]|uniref:hypothetical protein n=1 Tax=Primorskyibacter sp. S87 TaxID=3415126 RepID=UPI003C7A3B41